MRTFEQAVYEAPETLAGKEPITRAEALAWLRDIFEREGGWGFQAEAGHFDELREIGRRLCVAGGGRLMLATFEDFEGGDPEHELMGAAKRPSMR